MTGSLIWLAALAALAGIGVLRWSWSRNGRVTRVNALAWGLLTLAVVLGGAEAGAWGVAVASLVAMEAATLALAWAAARSSAGKARASDRRAGMLPEGGEPLRLGGRIATFVLVVAGGFAASIALGIALRSVALLAGWGEANANATALIAVPLGWGVLATILLMQHRRRSQVATLALASLPLLPALLLGE